MKINSIGAPARRGADTACAGFAGDLHSGLVNIQTLPEAQLMSREPGSSVITGLRDVLSKFRNWKAGQEMMAAKATLWQWFFPCTIETQCFCPLFLYPVCTLLFPLVAGSHEAYWDLEGACRGNNFIYYIRFCSLFKFTVHESNKLCSQGPGII